MKCSKIVVWEKIIKENIYLNVETLIPDKGSAGVGPGGQLFQGIVSLKKR